jgi:DHA2 family multidrug resistance protein
VMATGSLWTMVYWSPETSAASIAISSVVQGLGLGFVFVPLNTVAFATLPGDLRTDGAAVWTLIRNLGSSIGISLIIAELTNMIGTFHSQLAERITPFNDALRMPDVANLLSLATQGGREALEGVITQQAAIMAYSNDFLLMTFVSLCAFPLLFLIRGAKAAPPASAPKEAHAAAMD